MIALALSNGGLQRGQLNAVVPNLERVQASIRAHNAQVYPLSEAVIVLFYPPPLAFGLRGWPSHGPLPVVENFPKISFCFGRGVEALALQVMGVIELEDSNRFMQRSPTVILIAKQPPARGFSTSARSTRNILY
jgi:hypothetical protein